MHINRYSLVPLPGIPSDNQIARIMRHTLIEGAASIDEALALGKKAAYDAAWPMLVVDGQLGGVSHKISVLGRVEEVCIRVR